MRASVKLSTDKKLVRTQKLKHSIKFTIISLTVYYPPRVFRTRHKLHRVIENSSSHTPVLMLMSIMTIPFTETEHIRLDSET